jgi:hypothetical protein
MCCCALQNDRVIEIMSRTHRWRASLPLLLHHATVLAAATAQPPAARRKLDHSADKEAGQQQRHLLGAEAVTHRGPLAPSPSAVDAGWAGGGRGSPGDTVIFDKKWQCQQCQVMTTNDSVE